MPRTNPRHISQMSLAVDVGTAKKIWRTGITINGGRCHSGLGGREEQDSTLNNGSTCCGWSELPAGMTISVLTKSVVRPAR